MRLKGRPVLGLEHRQGVNGGKACRQVEPRLQVRATVQRTHRDMALKSAGPGKDELGHNAAGKCRT